MNLASVIGQTLANHPDIALSAIKPDIAATEKERIRGQLDPAITASTGFIEDQTPANGSFSANQSLVWRVQGNVSKPLAGGGTLRLEANYNRTDMSFDSPLASQIANFNPAYRNHIDLSYRLPLLRGAGRPAYHQSLAAAESNTVAAVMEVRMAAEQLALRALNLYYAMSSSDINVRLANDTVLRAEKLLAYQLRREEFGLIESADRLQAEALLATRKMEREQAMAALLESKAELNRLMLRPPDSELSLEPDIGESGPIPSLVEAVRTAETQRPELEALAARLDAVDARLLAARDDDRLQLDVVATVGGRGLNDQAGAAFTQGFSLNDRFASLAVEFSDTVGRHATKSSIRKAELERQQLLLERGRSLERIRDELSQALVALQTGETTLVASMERVQAERDKFLAEEERYREGRSDTATIVQFEGELRLAELVQALEDIRLRRAHRLLQWAQGSLLNDLGLNWPNEP